ncbi:MAG: hypothetical protein IJL56_00515 [Bacteroidales bacterium]|nr:hypothetical protein [Bacteroidales bacterium]
MKPICTKAAATFLSAAAFLFACCSKPSSAEETVKDKIAFRQNELMLFVGEEAAVPVTYQIFDRGVYVDAEYDFKADPLGVIIGSSDPDVATVSGGKVRGKAKGTCTLTLSSDKVKAGGQLVVTVKENEVTPGAKFNQDITQPLTADMIALPLGLQTGMQSFDIDKRGRFYMSTEDNTSMRVCALNMDGSKVGSDMVLPSGGHGDGFSIEYGSDEVFFWTSGTMGEHTDNGGYSGGKANGPDVRLICRHKFKAGATEYAEDAVERFYLNPNGARFVDVDTEHDVMLLWTYENSSDYLYVYKLSEIRNAQQMTTKVTRTSHNEGKSVTAYNLNTVKYIARFPWKRKGVATGETNSGAVQGLCIYDDRIYVTSGAKNDEATLMSVLDFSGNILQKLVKVGVSVDKQQLIKLNLSSDGTFEPEGLHIHNGQMYLGFVGDYPTSGSKKHTCVIKLK